ncbi:hypothetical protein Tco_0912785 [Tanacetum coccineum]
MGELRTVLECKSGQARILSATLQRNKLIARNCTQPTRPRTQITARQDVDELSSGNGGGIGMMSTDDCDAFDSDVDEAPTAQTMFMANLSSVDPVYDEASPSYDSDILSEYMIPYDQYVKDNAVKVVQSNVSYVPNDAYMMILNDIYEPSAQCVSVPTQNNVVDNSLTAELATYKEQVELYERRAKFELTKREQKINEQLRIVIVDRNRKEENLKRELHSVKLQLTSTINHNKSMVEEVTDFQPQKTIDPRARILVQDAHHDEKLKLLRADTDFTTTQSVNNVSSKFTHAMLIRDVEPIPPRNRNNREVHLDYLKHLKESVETLREIVEEAKVERPLDSSLAFACLYTKHSQELLEYVIDTCPKDFIHDDKKPCCYPSTRKKQFI